MMTSMATAFKNILFMFCVSSFVIVSLDEARAQTDNEKTSTDSPRVSLAKFLELTRAGNYIEAVKYLDLSPEDQAQGAQLARRLKAVLDQRAWIDLDLISSQPEGTIDDHLPPGIENIAKISTTGGVTQVVRMRLFEENLAPHWKFTRATVGHINSWYEQLDNRWALENLPEFLLRPGPQELLRWQWITLFVLILLAGGLGILLSKMTRSILGRFASWTESKWDDVVIGRISGPLSLGWMLILVSISLPWLGLSPPAIKFIEKIIHNGIWLVLFWLLFRLVEVVIQIIGSSSWSSSHPASRNLLPLTSRVLKVILLFFAVITLLSELGFRVTSLIAGLGIGGLAFALAAQKTVENLFGAFSIGVDQPFREGDFVRIEDFVGTVEKIGLRSTQIRTLDRTLISLPNGKLADMRLESYTARDRIRLACTLGVVYETTAQQMKELLTGFESVLRKHSMIWPEAVIVRFKEFGDCSLNIDIMAWFKTSDWNEFQAIRQDVLLQFMEVVENVGSSFAFPTRTVHLVAPSTADLSIGATSNTQ